MNPNEEPPKAQTNRRSLALFAAFAVVALLQLFATLPAIDAPGALMDEGMLLYYPELLTKGLIPQRDFESMYPPGNIWFLSGVYAVLGTTIQVERSCGLLYQMALVAAAFTLLSRWGAAAGMAGGILGIFALFPLNLVAYAWVGGSAFALWAVVAISARGRPELRGALAGGLAGLALTYRTDLGPALLLSLSTYCLLAGWKIRPVCWLVGAFTISLIPLFTHILVVTPAVFIDNIFVKPVLTCSHGRALPLNYSSASIGELYTLLLLSIGLAILAGWRDYRNKISGDPALITAGLLSLGALPQALMRSDLPHLSFIAPLAFPLLVPTAMILFARHILTPAVVVASVFILVPQTTGLLFGNFSGKASPGGNSFTVRSGKRTFPLAKFSEARASQEVINRMAEISKPGEKVFVGQNDLRFAFANDLYLYHLLPWLSPRSYYLEMNPLSANRPGSGVVEQIADCDWLILNHAWDRVFEPNDSQLPGPDAPNHLVRDRFDLVFTRPPFDIYKRHSASAPGGDAGRAAQDANSEH